MFHTTYPEDMTDNKYGDAPLGRSIEDIEDESGNRENSSVQREDVGSHGGMTAAIIPIPAGPSGGAVPAVIANPERVDGRSESGAADGQGGKQRDTSE